MKRFLFIIVVAFAFASSAQTASRLIGFAEYINDSTISARDTGAYIYSGDNGGEIMAYSNPSINADYPIQLFNIVDFVTGLNGVTKFDTAWSTTNHINYRGFKQVLDADKNVVSSIDEYNSQQLDSFDYDHHLLQRITNFWVYSSSSWLPDRRYYYNYDGYGRLQESVNQRWYRGNWQNLNRAIYSYDIYNQLFGIDSYSWDTVTTSWLLYSSRHYYYSGGMLDSVILLNGSSGAVMDKAVHYFSAANDTIIVNYYNPLGNYLRFINTYNSAHLKTASTSYYLDLSSNNLKIEWTYNSYNQVTSSRTYLQDTSGNWRFYDMFKFYYEPYTSGVEAVQPIANKLKIYPIPAQEMVMVKMDWQEPGPFVVSLCDINGRVLGSWNEPPTSIYRQTIPLAGLSPGCYVLRIVSEKENVSRQFMKE